MVELPDVKATRMGYGVDPVRKLPQDEDYYTLPMIHDAATDTWIGDSFDIAVYLDNQYEKSGERLFPPNTIGVHRVFNAHVDALFSRHVGLCFQGMLFNPDTAEISKAEFVRRARSGGRHVASYQEFCIEGEARTKMLEAFKADLEDFAKLYKVTGGPFLEGDKMTYADVIVGSWLAFMKATLSEWSEIREWQGGRWERLCEALRPWAQIK